MEADEALRRIVVRHHRLLVVLIVVALAAIVPWRLSRPAMYAATAKIDAQGATPQAATEAAAILSRVSAVAQSPDVVGAALAKAHVQRDRAQVLRELNVTSVGSSAVVAIKITDASPNVALLLAQAAASSTVGALSQLSTGQTAAQEAAMTKQINQLNATHSSLVAQLGASGASQQSTSSPAVAGLLGDLASVNGQLSSVMAAQDQLRSTMITTSGAAVISLPNQSKQVSTGVVTDAVLGVLLALVLGLLLSTIRELIQPSVAGPRAAGRELGVPLIGEVMARQPANQDLVARLSWAAGRAEVRTLVVTGPVADAHIEAVAAALDEGLEAAAAALVPGGHAGPDGRGSRPSLVSADSDRGLQRGQSGHLVDVRPPPHPASSAQLRAVASSAVVMARRPLAPALVVLVPNFPAPGDLRRTADLSALTGWQILGVIGIQPRRRRHRRRDGREFPIASPNGPGEE